MWKKLTALFVTVFFLGTAVFSFGSEDKPKRFEGFFRNVKPPLVTPMKPSLIDPTQPIEPDSSNQNFRNTLRRFPIGERATDRYEKRFPIHRLEKDPKNFTMRLNPVPEGFRTSQSDRRNYNQPNPEEGGLFIPGLEPKGNQPPLSPERKRFFYTPPTPTPKK